MGADAVLNLEEVTEEKQRRQWVRDHTDGRGADIVIQVANNMAVPEGLTLLRGGGRYLNIGAGGKANIAVEKIPQEMLFITVRSGEPRHWLQAIDFLASRRKTFPFEEMISKSYKLGSDQRGDGSDGKLLGGESRHQSELARVNAFQLGRMNGGCR